MFFSFTMLDSMGVIIGLESVGGSLKNTILVSTDSLALKWKRPWLYFK